MGAQATEHTKNKGSAERGMRRSWRSAERGASHAFVLARYMRLPILLLAVACGSSTAATDSVRDAFPGSNVEEYKQAFLEHIRGLGLRIVAAYGNASSDVCAYERAGVPPRQTWIVGDNGGTGCDGADPTHALTSYVEHLAALQSE